MLKTSFRLDQNIYEPQQKILVRTYTTKILKIDYFFKMLKNGKGKFIMV